MRAPGGHVSQPAVEVLLDLRRRLILGGDLSGHRGVAPATDEDLATWQLPPVAISEMRVSRYVALGPGDRCGGEHRGSGLLDLHLRQQEWRVGVGGENDDAGAALTVASAH